MRNIILIIALLFSNYLVAQKNVKNKAVVVASKMNIVYCGIDNPIEIAVPNLSSKKIKISCANANVSGENGKYNLQTELLGELRIRVYSLNNLDTIEHGIVYFRSIKTPDPIIKFANFGFDGANDCSNIKVFQNIPGIIADIENFDFDVKFFITQFQVKIIKKDKALVSSLINGPYFSEEVKKWISELEIGDTLHVFNIKVKAPEPKERDIEPVIIVFKKDR